MIHNYKDVSGYLDNLRPDQAFIVYSGDERYPKGDGIEAIGVHEMARELAALQGP